MTSAQSVRRHPSSFQQLRWLALAGIVALSATQPTDAATNLVIWDTGSRYADSLQADERAAWKAVPSELFLLEADPPKAASDPGYYGREYSFHGDVVVENRTLAAVFWSARGRVVVYSKALGSSSASPTERAGLGRKILEILPAKLKTGPGKIARCEILRNAADEAVMKVSFSTGTSAAESVVFSFGKNEIIEIKPAEQATRLSLLSPIRYGLAPSFIGDDLIVNPSDHARTEVLGIPAENLFVGLLEGENDQWVLTWPRGKQQLQMQLASDSQAGRRIESLDFDHDGQAFYVAALSAPGIWHREELKPSYLEKDVALSWTRPFPARWKTQLSEAGVRTTFAFRDAKGQIWRGVPGSYNYPVWFDGDKAFYHLSKKVPPKGESLVYFLEGQDTPAAVSTPVDILKATLGRPMSEAILDVAGRKLRTHHRRGGDGVHRACTCGCTEAIQAVFEAGEEVVKQHHVSEALGDMNFFVQCHLERIEEYRRFAAELLQLLQAKKAAAPALKPFLEGLEQTAQLIPQEYNVQLENMKSLAHADELTRKTLALTKSKNTNNLPAYMDLLKAWRAMGGAQDYVVAHAHTVARRLFQEAGYGCLQDANALAVAQEVRARCRQVLRNPDGYEIWANY